VTRQLTLAKGEFSIILPGTWAAIPLDDEAETARHIKNLVARQVGRNDRLARTRREAREELTDVAEQAKASGAITLALSLEILPGVPFPASLVVTEDAWPTDSRRSDDDLSDNPPSDNAASDNAASDNAADDGAPDDLAERLRLARPKAEILDFVSGPVARLSQVGEIALGSGTTTNVAAQYWVPVDHGDRLFLVLVDAPMAEAPDLYLELFDAIVDSMTWIPDAAHSAN
jgi:hypothetical protein